MRRFLSLLLNAWLARTALTVLTRLLFRFDVYGVPERLLVENLSYFRYFTVLANGLMGVAAALYVLAELLALCGVLRARPGWVCRLKFVAVVLMALTLTVALVYLGPREGLAQSFGGANLWLHLILPVAAVLDWALLDGGDRPAMAETLSPPLAVAVYALFYIGNLLLHGYGGRGHPNDWYGFADRGPGGVYLAFILLIAIAWGLALLLRAGRKNEKEKGLPHAE